MSSPSDHDRHLEQWAHRTLHNLPPRRAPRSLEQRVLAELERRVALPWWRKSFGHWPMAARVAFVFVCAVLARLALMAGGWLSADLDPAHVKAVVAEPYSWMESGLAVVKAITGFCDIIARNIPPIWLYAALAVFAAMYAALFGLGAAAYRAFHTHD